MVDLKTVSDADLFGEVQRRRDADLKERIEVGKVMAKRIVKNLDALLELVPFHSKQSCADSLPLFVHDGCTRCQLMEIKRKGVSDFEIDTIKLKLLYNDGSALVVGAFPQPQPPERLEFFDTLVAKHAAGEPQPVCECGHILARHHGDLGLNKCLVEGCTKCPGFVQRKDKVHV